LKEIIPRTERRYVVNARKAQVACCGGSRGLPSLISDGLAANCGDAACTTFGTTVTGGGGALKLLLWNNGQAWTLRGK
jgi:hypothetical protein